MAYKMRTVKSSFTGPHPTNLRLTAPIPRLVLECGHIITDSASFYYDNEVAVKIKLASHKIGGHPRKVRCYACAGGLEL